MEQDVDSGYRTVCSTCLSIDRDLFAMDGSQGSQDIFNVFCLLMNDFAGDRYGDPTIEIQQLVCWECVAVMKRFYKFKNQVQSAQEHLRILAMSRAQETVDHTYMSQSLSTLEVTTKADYDKIYFDYTHDEWSDQFVTIAGPVKPEQYDVTTLAVRDNISLDINHTLLQVPEIVVPDNVMSHIVVETNSSLKTELEINSATQLPQVVEIAPDVKPDPKSTYTTEYMTEAEMLSTREEMKQKVQYASSVYKCELCIIGFYTQQQVEDHFTSEHKAKPGRAACRVCYVYVEESRLAAHTRAHYTRLRCRLCARTDTSARLMQLHAAAHLAPRRQRALLPLHPACPQTKKKKKSETPAPPPKPGDLRKLLSRTTIEGYQCLECDMFFKNSRARKNHVARFHREGLQCDHCKKRFVNRTTLTTHLKLHEGPLPRSECPICHKMVRVIQLKYHIQRHEDKSRYECADCRKVFSHLATYQAHLKYSRAHASDAVLKFPCPMCNKGYPTKEAMQDHFNYQHLGKTSHKCHVCDKPIASRANVEKHMMRVHGTKKEKPRNHVCPTCRKAFTDRKALNQHLVIHSGERPLSCDVCQQTFKHKASLYTHRKRVHKVFPQRRPLQYVQAPA